MPIAGGAFTTGNIRQHHETSGLCERTFTLNRLLRRLLGAFSFVPILWDDCRRFLTAGEHVA